MTLTRRADSALELRFAPDLPSDKLSSVASICLPSLNGLRFAPDLPSDKLSNIRTTAPPLGLRFAPDLPSDKLSPPYGAASADSRLRFAPDLPSDKLVRHRRR